MTNVELSSRADQPDVIPRVIGKERSQSDRRYSNVELFLSFFLFAGIDLEFGHKQCCTDGVEIEFVRPGVDAGVS